MLPLFSPAISVVVYIFGKTPLGGEGIGEQLAAFDPLAHIFKQMQQKLIALPLDQQIERRQDRQSRLDQRKKLLVENQERRSVSACRAPALASAGAEDGAWLDPVDEITLLREPVMDLGFGIAVLHLLPQVALLVRDFDQELCHALLFRSHGRD